MFFVSYINQNDQDKTHPWVRRLETLYIEQKVSQPIKLNFGKFWRVWIFCSKNMEILAYQHGHFKIAKKKLGIQAISLLFESVASSIEVF